MADLFVALMAFIASNTRLRILMFVQIKRIVQKIGLGARILYVPQLLLQVVEVFGDVSLHCLAVVACPQLRKYGSNLLCRSSQAIFHEIFLLKFFWILPAKSIQYNGLTDDDVTE